MWCPPPAATFGENKPTAMGTTLHDGSMLLDARSEYIIDRPAPPTVGKNLDFGIAREAFRLDSFAYRFDIDHTITHHSAIVEEVGSWHQPVTDVKRH